MSEENKKPEINVPAKSKPLRLVPLHMMRSRENFWKLAVVVLLLVVSYFNYSYYQATSKREKLIITRSQSLRAMESENFELVALTDEQAQELLDFFANNKSGAAPMLRDDSEMFSLKIFIPFLNKYEIDVQVNAGIMTVNGNVTADKVVKKKKAAVENIITHHFTYTIPLPANADLKKIKMDKTANVLTVTIPKKVAKPAAKAAAKPAAKPKAN
jgi:HSP20 family molecular chaperone IbpA